MLQLNSPRLPRSLVNRLLHEAQLKAEFEICGLIGARDGQPLHVYPIKNIAPDPKTRFQMDPEQQIAAMQTLRERGETLFAIYHSHPTAPASPSEEDLQQAAYPEALYLIISLNTKGVLEMRGFCQTDQGMKEVVLSLEDPK